MRTVTSRSLVSGFLLLTAAITHFSVAQETEAEDTAENEAEIEEMVVTGSQIKGVDVSGILPVSVMEAEDIDVLGVSSGDELIEMLPEQGQNFFNEEENISGGVNAARGDIGAFNLRNLGTGNTLVLLNGRRLVNAASYQTEEVGGSFVPVNTVNSNVIPVFGIDRIEVFKDSAAAVYGADAVAGVVNTVLERDIEGMAFRWRGYFYDNVGRQTHELNGEWGDVINDGRTHVGVMFDVLTRDNIHSSEDSRWADSDFRRLIPSDSRWSGSTSFRNNSANSNFGQFDSVRSVSRFGLTGITDRSGEFQVYPIGDEECDWELSATTCGAVDGPPLYRYNLNEFRDLSSELQRYSAFVFVNHDFGNGLEGFTELSWYSSTTVLSRHPSAPFSSVKLRVGPENYHNPFGPCGSPNRLPESMIPRVPCEGLLLEIDNYRFAEVPRIIENDGFVYRLLQGLRGVRGNWDWETAAVWSVAEREDLTRNRVSNTLMAEALFDPTPAAYNPFSGGVNTNIERALVDVRRDNEMTLFLVDFKLSSNDVYTLPTGPMGMLLGTEYRSESFEDDRDPRLDGTIVFTDYQGDTFPFVSDVVNSSPTPDSSGDRNVFSLFGELQIPIMNRVDSLLAARYENFSDVGDTVVGRAAIGWRPHDALQFRASISEAFRAPNLITINEDIVARQNTRTDWTCFYAAEHGGDPDQDIVDCRNSTQRVAQGSSSLVPERSDNTTIGVVFDPTGWFTLTLDYWTIEKNDTIGLFGEENHTVYDLLLRLQQGNQNCAALQANPAVSRLSDIEDDVAGVYQAAGLCPAGDVHQILDNYANFDTRTLSGRDIGFYLDFEWPIGDITLKYLRSSLNEFEQNASGPSAMLLEAKRQGIIPLNIPIAGFTDGESSDLVRKNGNQEFKEYLLVRWSYKSYATSISSTKLGDFYQDSLTLSDGTQYVVPAFRTWNISLDARTKLVGDSTRFRFGVRNASNERAPLADRYFGFYSDAHRDYGRYYYFDVRITRR